MIRPATSSDASWIADVHVRTWQHAYRGLVSSEVLDNLSITDRTQQWSEILALGRESQVLVDATPEAVRGFVSVGPSRDDSDLVDGAWEIYAIYVAPHCQGQGLGKELLWAALDSVPASVPRVTLWVFADNQHARQFYEAQGFKTDGAKDFVKVGDEMLPEIRYELRNPHAIGLLRI